MYDVKLNNHAVWESQHMPEQQRPYSIRFLIPDGDPGWNGVTDQSGRHILKRTGRLAKSTCWSIQPLALFKGIILP